MIRTLLPLHRADFGKALAVGLAGALGYFLFAYATIMLTSDGRSHATVWLADAVILALLMVQPRHNWLVILLAGWAANCIANGVTREWAFGIALYGVINMGQVLLVAWYLRRKSDSEDLLADLPAAGRFILWAGLIAPLLGALVGSCVTWLSYGEPFVLSFFRWFSSNSLGLLILTPLLCSVFDGSYARWFRGASSFERTEFIAVMVAHILVTAYLFLANNLPLLFVPFAILILISFRLGELGAKAGVMIVALIGAWASMNNIGPLTLVQVSPEQQAFFFQIYLATLIITILPAATVLVQRQSRAEALRMEAIGRISGGVAHDFNNLLQVITGNIEICMARTADPVQRNALDVAMIATDRAASLTAQLLSYGRKQFLRPEVIDLNALVRTEASTLQSIIGPPIDIVVETPLDAVLVRLDPNRMAEAILNLAINARDAMPEGGILRFEVSVSHENARKRAVLTIRDQGSGIAPDDLPKVLDPFFTTKDVGSGTGLGLSMVHGFVKQSGGHIDIASKLGQGTTISLRFPLVSAR